jgi:uncharacterized protein (DUF924 family)
MIPASMPLAPLAAEILEYWFVPRAGEPQPQTPPAKPGAGVTRDVWFGKDDAFDDEIRARFGVALAAGLAGAFGEWCTTPKGCLARVVLLDQFTRNAFRGTPQAFAGDPAALATAEDAVERGFDDALAPQERWFLYMPFEHSESIAQQDRAVALFEALAAQTGLAEPLPWAEKHREVIRRFGRFPHRNEILGRVSTPAELQFLHEPGSRF